MRDSEARLNVIVTGVGALIGQGIIKSLRLADYSVRIIGVDRGEWSFGASRCDAFHQKPFDETGDEYLGFWQEIIESESVDLVIPGLEVDVDFLEARRAWFAELKVRLALNCSDLIAATRDKWLFDKKHFAGTGLAGIPTCVAESWEAAIGQLGPPPLLLKPKIGNGSRGHALLRDKSDFEYWRRKSGSNWMIQRVVGTESEEYTVGVFGLGNGEAIGPIVMKRRLSSNGFTQQAQVVSDSAIEEASLALTRHFKPIGATNYQFRRERQEALLLEINPRFSSSNSLRTAFNFNEALMTIDFFIFDKTPAAPTTTSGMAYRYNEDFIVHDCSD